MIRTLLVALIAWSVCPLAVGAGEAKKRPNILMLVADDWGWPHAGFYGDKVVKLPNIERVARQGMVFHRAYCAAPTCSPSRAGLLTGQAIQRLKEGGNLWGVLPKEFVCYPDVPARAGYVLGLVGKGWGPGSLEGTERLHNPAGPPAKNFRDFVKGLPPDRPFCFWFGSKHPHRPYKLGSGVKAGVPLEAIQVPPVWPDTKEVRSDIADYYAAVQIFDQEVGDILQILQDAGLADNTIVVLIGDNGMPFPRGKANLYDLGTHLPLIVRWPGKTKEGGQSNAFISFTDLAPTFLEAAGLRVLPEMTGKSLLKILTGADDGMERTKVFTARERHANVRTGDTAYPIRAIRTEQFLYLRNFRPKRWPAGDPETHFAVGPYGDIDDGPTKQLLMKLGQGTLAEKRLHDLSLAKRPAEELYDCQKDPYEMTNLAGRPEYAKVKARLRADLDKYMADTADPRAEPNGGDDRWDRYKYYGGPWKVEKKGKPSP